MAQDQQPVCPLPSRRQIHGRTEGVRSSAPARQVTDAAEVPVLTRRARHGRRAARGAVLFALAGATLAVPLAGWVSPDDAVAFAAKTSGATAVAATWSRGSVDSMLEPATDLEVQQGAASRARLRAPLVDNGCVNVEAAADGARPVVRESPLYWPLEQGTFQFTSGFGPRVSPLDGSMQVHEGTDLAAPMGTPIHAIADGEVVKVDLQAVGAGTSVIIKHTIDGQTWYSRYYHEYPQQILVHQGQVVKAGERIGAVGSNGWSTGAHLHLQIHTAADVPIDPMPWMRAHGAVYIGQECQ